MNVTLTPSFLSCADRLLKIYAKAHGDIYNLVAYLSKNPTAGTVVTGYAGLIYKVRWPLKSYKEGKSGGLRAYYLFSGGILKLFYLYSKKEMADAPKEVIQNLVKNMLAELHPSQT